MLMSEDTGFPAQRKEFVCASAFQSGSEALHMGDTQPHW